MENSTNPPVEKGSRFKIWIKRMGVAGFLFFLLKGIAWLVVGGLLGKCAMG